MLDARRHRLLAEMGITPWRLREGVPPAAAPSLTPADLDRWRIALPAGAGPASLEVIGAELQVPAVKKLLGAMLSAIGLDLVSAQAPEPLAQPADLVLAFGDAAAEALCGAGQSVAVLRGQWQQTAADHRRLIVTHHPASLLEQPALKAEAWADLQRLQGAWQGLE